MFAFSKQTIIDESREWMNYATLDFLEFQVLIGLMSKAYFDEDMGALAHDQIERTDYYRIRELAGGVYHAEML